MRIIHLLLLLIAPVALSALAGCGENEAQAEPQTRSGAQGRKPPQQAPMERPEHVRVQEVAASDLTEYVIARGTTQAVRDVTYSAETSGRIEALPVELGDRIRKGRIIARIDFDTLKAQAEQANAAYALAKNTYDRLASIKDADVVSSQQIDEARSAMVNARAGLSIAEANVKKSVVRASYSGIVGAKFVEKGEFVGPGTPLVKVIDYKTIIVEAQVPETQVDAVRTGTEATVEIEALNRTFTGAVDTLIPTADKESKTFTLRVTIDNPDYAILVGMASIVKIRATTHEDVVVLAQSTVIEDPGSRSVFVAENGRAVQREVTLGPVQGDKVVITSGVSPGESVITVGQRDLKDGQPIKIVQ